MKSKYYLNIVFIPFVYIYKGKIIHIIYPRGSISIKKRAFTYILYIYIFVVHERNANV